LSLFEIAMLAGAAAAVLLGIAGCVAAADSGEALERDWLDARGRGR
jgi:hypothetical protein